MAKQVSYSKLLFRTSKINSSDDYYLSREKGQDLLSFSEEINVQKVRSSTGDLLLVLWYIPHVAEIAMVILA
jgi:hypothetical protein